MWHCTTSFSCRNAVLLGNSYGKLGFIGLKTQFLKIDSKHLGELSFFLTVNWLICPTVWTWWSPKVWNKKYSIDEKLIWSFIIENKCISRYSIQPNYFFLEFLNNFLQMWRNSFFSMSNSFEDINWGMWAKSWVFVNFAITGGGPMGRGGLMSLKIWLSVCNYSICVCLYVFFSHYKIGQYLGCGHWNMIYVSILHIQ